MQLAARVRSTYPCSSVCCIFSTFYLSLRKGVDVFISVLHSIAFKGAVLTLSTITHVKIKWIKAKTCINSVFSVRGHWAQRTNALRGPTSCHPWRFLGVGNPSHMHNSRNRHPKLTIASWAEQGGLPRMAKIRAPLVALRDQKSKKFKVHRLSW